MSPSLPPLRREAAQGAGPFAASPLPLMAGCGLSAAVPHALLVKLSNQPVILSLPSPTSRMTTMEITSTALKGQNVLSQGEALYTPDAERTLWLSLSKPQGSFLHLTSHISNLTSHISHLTSHISHLTSHISHLTSQYSILTSQYSHLKTNVYSAAP